MPSAPARQLPAWIMSIVPQTASLSGSSLLWLGQDKGGAPQPPGSRRKRSTWLADLAARHRGVRVLLHLIVILRFRKDIKWHCTCIWREIHEVLHPK